MAQSSPAPPARPQRRHPAHPPPVHKHNRSVIVYVTVCLAEREPILANTPVHDASRQAWAEADQWLVGFYLIMPDHVHWFCAPACHCPAGVKEWVTFWKSRASRLAPELRSRWLPDCWDTQMRTQEQYLRKLDYVAQNPVRKGLVTTGTDWPYQGRMTELPWIGG